MQILKLDSLRDVPWKNGGGTTREIAVGQIDGQTVWRISRADVGQDGAFSDFSGMMRILTVVSGAGMALDHPGGTLDADPWLPVRFDGALAIRSRLKDGPLTDLNLIFDPTVCTGAARVHQGPLDLGIECPDAGVIALVALAGSPAVDAAPLAPGDTAFATGGASALTLAEGDALLELQIGYRTRATEIRHTLGGGQ